MRLGSSHGAIPRVIGRSQWPRRRLSVRQLSYALSDGLRKSFAPLQLDAHDRPFTPREQPNPAAKDVAVIGGGITGLATAFELSSALPDAKITIYEAASRLGGWLDSEVVPVDGGEVLFEWGPRSLRNSNDGTGAATMRLLAYLDMASDILAVPADSLAGRNRYIYYPDHLVRMPAPIPGAGAVENLIRNVAALVREPIFRGVLRGILAEPAVDPRPFGRQDESVGDFVTRRFGAVIANNLVSAMFHGIYAGDIYKLSTRVLLPKLWHLETKDSGILGSSVTQTYNGDRLVSFDMLDFLAKVSIASSPPQQQVSHVLQALSNSPIYTFKRGLGQLASRLESTLRARPNVSIMTSTPVAKISFSSPTNTFLINDYSPEDAEYPIYVRPGSPSGPVYDYVISTLSHTQITWLLRGSGGNESGLMTARQGKCNSSPGEGQTSNGQGVQHGTSMSRSRSTVVVDKVDLKDIHNIRWTLQHAFATPSANPVMVVNLFWSTPPSALSPILHANPGFGYLIPRSVPLTQNPERALGVVFSASSSVEDGSASAAERSFISPDTVPGTKLTVILGGHWWGDVPSSDLPSPAEGIELAQSLLARHLDIREPPTVAKARLAEKAIPQYAPGYRARMTDMHKWLVRKYRGRLKVAGPWWQGGVGVNDCIRKAWEIAWDVREGRDETTGLEQYEKAEKWVLVGRDGRMRWDEREEEMS